MPTFVIPSPPDGTAHVTWVRPHPSWRDHAACLGMDVNLFHPPSETGEANQEQIAEAKAVCRRCPAWVREECLADALATDGSYPHGVRGGLSAAERDALARSRSGTRITGARVRTVSPLELLSQTAREALLAAGIRGRVADTVEPRVKSELVRSGLCDEAIRTSKSRNEGGVRANQTGREALRRWYKPALLEVSS